MDLSASLLRPATPSAAMRVSSLLQVAPRTVEFRAFEFHHEYLALLTVRNASDRALRFRITPPAPVSPFKVLYQEQDLATTANPTMMLPPGLSIKLEVLFVPPVPPRASDERAMEHALVHDALELQGDDDSRVQVPLVARKAFPELELDATLCDLGLVVTGHRAATLLHMRNVGTRAGRFEIDVLDGSEDDVAPQRRRPSAVSSSSIGSSSSMNAATTTTTTATAVVEAPVTVTPSSGVLTPGETLALQIHVVGKTLGVVRGVVRVRVCEYFPDDNNDSNNNDSSGPETLGLSPSTCVVDKLLDVRATVVEHNVELLQRVGGDKVQNLFFGALFAGESRVIETVLRNNGPLPLLFRATLNFGGSGGGGGGATGLGAAGGGGGGGGGGDLTGEEDREAYERRKELRVEPAEGRVEPFAEVPLVFTYHPRNVDLLTLQQLERKLRLQADKSHHDDDISHSSGNSFPPVVLSAFASIQCADMQAQNLTFEISGKMFLPKLELTPASLDFGDIKSHDRVDMLVSIKNVSGLPVGFSIPRLAQFATKPSSGRLDVLQSQSIVVSFVPSQLGTFKSKLEIVVNKDVIAFPISVQGTAAALGDTLSHDLVGGPTALPRDFEPKYKFMLADDAQQTKGKLTRKFHRMAPYELAALNGTAAIDEFEFQGTNNTHLTYCVKELADRADHRQQYNAFVTELRRRREDKQKKKTLALKQTVSMLRTTSNNDCEDGSGMEIVEDVALNLGMDRQGGVEPRMLKLPRELVANPEPLWLENQVSSGPNGKSKKHFFDDNKFVKKKFKPQPATQAEIADCGQSLSFDQLEMVACGPKTIQFGKLSVNGLGKKSLSVQNNLSKNIFVALQLSESDHMDELATHTVLKSQVIPPQTLAGFDLVFCSNKEQFFQKPLTLTINGVHTRQITVVAEIAPIVVALSATELPFEFSSTDTNASMAMELVVTNTSDSVAPFQWKLLPPPLVTSTKPRPDSSKSNATAVTTAAENKQQSDKHQSVAAKPIFEIVPASGTLKAAETLRCQVIYTPPHAASGSSPSYAVLPSFSSGVAASGNDTANTTQPQQQWLVSEFQLEIVGGRKASLTCKALFAEAKFQLRDKKIDFGMIAVGMEKEKKVVLSNPANAEQDGFSQRLVFHASVEPASVASALGLSISPTIGSILPQDSCEISLKMSPHKPLVLENNAATLNLQLRGGRCVKIPLLASVVIPDVKITQVSPLDFEEVILGVSVPRIVSLENHSSIAACLVLDLNATLSDEFSIALPSKLTRHLEDVSSVFMPLMVSSSSSILPETAAATTAVAVAGSSLDQEDADDSRCAKWQLCVPPNTTVSFHLLFTPRVPGKHDALLPLQFAGLGHVNASIARPESITCRVVARAVAPRVLFSPSAVIQFHRCVITREGIRKVPYTKTLQLTNNDPSGATIKWQIDTSKFKAAAAATLASSSKRTAASSSSSSSSAANNQSQVVFHMAPEKGELAPGEDVKIRVSFLPMEAVEYGEDDVPLLVDDQFYINLSVSGVGIHPHLSFSENKIVLPTVPLGIPSVARFYIQSTGYDHLELTFRLPLDVSKAPITLQFPKGKILSMASPKIPCEVRFLSKKSVAFNARIEFFDADGNVFYLPIAGCTENCLLTNHEFVCAHSEPIGDQDHDGGGGPQAAPPVPSLCYFTHPTFKFPIYFIGKKQAETETAKYKTQLIKEKAAAEAAIAPASGSSQPSQSHVQSQAQSQTPSAAASVSGGFVDVDASALAAETSGQLVTTFSEREIQFLMQYLNANFLKTPIVKFPHDVANTLGKPLYELLEMVCTKKPPANAMVGSSVSDKTNKTTNGSKSASSSSGNSSNSTNSGPSKKEQLAQYTAQYTELLKFLKSYGAMLHDVLPEHLLAQELYVRACEDPRADPAILSSAALLSMKFLQRRHALQSEWASVSACAWMKVLYQVVKCFLLYRITQKSYSQQAAQFLHHGGALAGAAATAPPPAPAPAAQQLKDKDKNKTATTTPQPQSQSLATSRASQGSNVYSEAEMVLVLWICDHVRSKLAVVSASTSSLAAPAGAFSPESRLLDLHHDLVDGKLLFHVLASHIPTLSLDSSDYRGFRLASSSSSSSSSSSTSTVLVQQNAPVLLHALRCFGVDFGIDPKHFLATMNAREMVVLLLHMYQMLPQFIPKATIEFKGVLGQEMEKTIELKNPSQRAIQYHAFLDGGEDSDFRIEASHVVLEPGKTLAFVVSFKPKFSKKVTARLVFQSVRDPLSHTSASGATMVFLLASNITARKPVRVVQIEANAYEKKIHELVVENQFLANANYKLTMTQMPMVATSGGGGGGGGGGAAVVPSPAASGSSKTKAVAAAATAVATATCGKESSGSFFGQSAPLSRRSSTQNIKPKSGGGGGDEYAADHAWCIAAQQPFYLPEYGAAAMAASGTSGGSATGDGGAGGGGGGAGVVVAIRSQSSATIKLEFVPLVPGNFKCQLLFLDEKVGEFMYEIHATAHLPATIETLEFQCELSPGLTGGGGGGGGGGGRGGGGSHFYRELTLPAKNLQLSKALATFVDRASGLLKTKLKEGLKKCEESHHASYVVEFNSPYFAPVFHEMTLSHSASNAGGGGGGGAKAAKQSVLSGEVPFTARTEASGVGGGGGDAKPAEKTSNSKHLARLATPRGGGGAGAMLSATPNAVLIDFQPKSAGLYTCKLLLRSHNTVCGSSDWRVYDLVAKVKEPNVKTLLEFVSPARHSIVQDIPLTNPSDTAWTLRALFGAGASASGFTGPSSIHIPPKKTINYPLTFAPKWISQEKTTLTLVNPATQQQFEFELSGFGEEPLAQDHVVLQCQARTSLVHTFDVCSFKSDPPGQQTFKIESDLRDVVGASTVVVARAGDRATYALTFSPIVSGTYFGSITFTNVATNEYIWYTIEASVAPPAPETTLEMKTPVRGAVGVEISLENPLDHAVEFTIELQGRGLMGPTSFELEAKQAGVYELVYSPLCVVESASGAEDGAVLFSNDEIGQFWYALTLVAEPAPTVSLDDMSCAVGDVCAQPILLQNPSDRELWLQYRVSNTRNFSIKGSSSSTTSGSESRSHAQPPVVKLAPFGQASVVLEYTPSSLSEFESARVVFFQPDVVSDWAFDVRGKGKAPSVMKPLRVQAKVHEAASTLFTFKNPFADALRVDVTLVAAGTGGSNNNAKRQRHTGGSGPAAPVVTAFDMLLKKSRVTLEGFAQLQVPISFLPPFVCDAHAEIVIQAAQDDYAELQWRYPIHGVAEAPLHPKPFVLACQAREPLEKLLTCELLTAPPGFCVQDEQITTSWEIDSARFGALASAEAIEQCLRVRAVADNPSSSSVESTGTAPTLSYVVQFEPLRPYRGSVYLVLHKKTGGAWRFEVVLDVGEPPVDDVIAIESSLNQTASVAFQLRNQFRTTASFHAEFSAGSSSAFTVYPSEGTLPAFGSDQGLSFVVSFTPTGYGKMQSGQLVILTEEMQWTFNVKGTYPDMSASLGSKSLSLSSSASRTRLGIDSASPGGTSSSMGSSSKSSKASRSGTSSSGSSSSKR